MELSITDKKENKSLGRTELACAISFDKAVPSRKEIREAICAAMGADPALLVVVSVDGRFGTCKGMAKAHLYKSKEGLAVERKYLLVRDGLAQKEAKAAQAKAPPAKK